MFRWGGKLGRCVYISMSLVCRGGGGWSVCVMVCACRQRWSEWCHAICMYLAELGPVSISLATMEKCLGAISYCNDPLVLELIQIFFRFFVLFKKFITITNFYKINYIWNTVMNVTVRDGSEGLVLEWGHWWPNVIHLDKTTMSSRHKGMHGCILMIAIHDPYRAWISIFRVESRYFG